MTNALIVLPKPVSYNSLGRSVAPQFCRVIRSIAELLGGFEATDVDISDADDNNKIGFSSI